jgi:hypothetical protein
MPSPNGSHQSERLVQSDQSCIGILSKGRTRLRGVKKLGDGSEIRPYPCCNGNFTIS